MLSIMKRHRTTRKWVTDVADGAFEPFSGQSVSLSPENSPVVYLPIPKAANTSIRMAMLQCSDAAPSDCTNVHHDPRLHRERQHIALQAAAKDAFVFTVARHPANRIRSAYRNKIGAMKKTFGPADRIGVSRFDSFDAFLEKVASVPSYSLDSHFRPQTQILTFGLQDPRLTVFKMEELADHWPDIAMRLSQATGKPPIEIGRHNESKQNDEDPFTDRQKRLIRLIYAEDFRILDYDFQRDHRARDG